MNKVTVEQIEENTYIDEPVFLDPNYILTSPEIPLTKELLERLKRWRFEHVLSNGMPTDAPPGSEASGGGAETATNLDQDEKEKEAQDEAERFFGKAVESTDKIFKDFGEYGTINQNLVTETVKEIMNKMKELKRFLLTVIQEKGAEYDVPYMVTHAVKTTILSLAITDTLSELSESSRFMPHKQIELGTGALLHEVGMLRIPPEVYQHDRKLTDKERKTINAHPVLSFKILKAEGFPNPVCLAVLEHHEYIDGTGYPRGINGNDISFYGKVLGVASSYAASVSKRPFRDESDGHTSIMDLVKSMGKRYDNKVLQALVYTLSIFPLGTYVMLSNGSKGLVIKTDTNAPKHPIIRLLTNENNEPYMERPTIQPKEEDRVTVQRPLTKSEVDELLHHILA